MLCILPGFKIAKADLQPCPGFDKDIVRSGTLAPKMRDQLGQGYFLKTMDRFPISPDRIAPAICQSELASIEANILVLSKNCDEHNEQAEGDRENRKQQRDEKRQIEIILPTGFHQQFIGCEQGKKTDEKYDKPKNGMDAFFKNETLTGASDLIHKRLGSSFHRRAHNRNLSEMRFDLFLAHEFVGGWVGHIPFGSTSGWRYLFKDTGKDPIKQDEIHYDLYLYVVLEHKKFFM